MTCVYCEAQPREWLRQAKVSYPGRDQTVSNEDVKIHPVSFRSHPIERAERRQCFGVSFFSSAKPLCDTTRQVIGFILVRVDHRSRTYFVIGRLSPFIKRWPTSSAVT